MKTSILKKDDIPISSDNKKKINLKTLNLIGHMIKIIILSVLNFLVIMNFKKYFLKICFLNVLQSILLFHCTIR